MNMEFWKNSKKQPLIIALFILICTVIAFLIRLLPMMTVAGTTGMIGGPDSWYYLRLIELALANNLTIVSFDPLTYFPYGMTNGWGPIFTLLCSYATILTGAVTRSDIINTINWVPPILGCLTVPVMFFLGKKLGDWRSGLLTALFTAVIGGQFLYTSYYSYVDHHVTEALFSLLFCLFYVSALYAIKNGSTEWKSIRSFKLPILFGAVCGIVCLLGMLVRTTFLVFALFVALFTLIQFIRNHKNGMSSLYILILNTVMFTVVIVGLLVNGFRVETLSLYNYSPAIVLAYLFLIAGMWVLYLISEILRRKTSLPWYSYPAVIFFLIVVGFILFGVFVPDTFSTAIEGLSTFFLPSDTKGTISEMQSWSLVNALSSFNIGLLLAICGLLYLLFRVSKNDEPAVLFIVIWSVLLLFATIQHVRWEYYLGGSIALLASLFVWKIYLFARDDLLLWFSTSDENNKKRAVDKKRNRNTVIQKSKKTGMKRVNSSKKTPDLLTLVIFLIVVVTCVGFIGISVGYNVTVGLTYVDEIIEDENWLTATEWLSTNTPDTGLNYYAVYEKNTFDYPEEAYGVLAWWDYGHYITTIGDRIPISNPFQFGVSGKYGAAQILLETEENAVEQKLDYLDVSYVMTDWKTAFLNQKFKKIVPWTNVDPDDYYITLLEPVSAGVYAYSQKAIEGYYNTLTVRLQLYDGSMMEAGNVSVLITDSSYGYEYPVITSAKTYDDADVAWLAADSYNANATEGKYAYVVGDQTSLLPITDIAALQHFRLIYESPEFISISDHSSSNLPGENSVAAVKTFEYVKGAVIKGTGTIEVDIMTNSGRIFTYQQESESGRFIVPYATGMNGDISAGIYKILETGKTFSVTEDAVMMGQTIN